MSQIKKLEELLLDGNPHRTDEIIRIVYGNEHLGAARLAARIDDLRKKGYVIPPAKKDQNNPSLFWYQMQVAKTYESGDIAPNKEIRQHAERRVNVSPDSVKIPSWFFETTIKKETQRLW